MAYLRPQEQSKPPRPETTSQLPFLAVIEAEVKRMAGLADGGLTFRREPWRAVVIHQAVETGIIGIQISGSTDATYTFVSPTSRNAGRDSMFFVSREQRTLGGHHYNIYRVSLVSDDFTEPDLYCGEHEFFSSTHFADWITHLLRTKPLK